MGSACLTGTALIDPYHSDRSTKHSTTHPHRLVRARPVAFQPFACPGAARGGKGGRRMGHVALYAFSVRGGGRGTDQLAALVNVVSAFYILEDAGLDIRTQRRTDPRSQPHQSTVSMSSSTSRQSERPALRPVRQNQARGNRYRRIMTRQSANHATIVPESSGRPLAPHTIVISIVVRIDFVTTRRQS